MKSVLLTGASGFIGRTAIRPLLERGFTVHATSSKPPPEAQPNVFWYKTDLFDASATLDLVSSVKPTHLLHFAWYVEHGKFWTAPENTQCVSASMNLVKNFAENGGKRVVMAGTCFEYDGYTDQESLSEVKSPLVPKSVYAVSKRDLYLKLQKYASENGLSYAWGRIFFLYGGFESPNRFVPSIVRSLLQNEEAKCSHGEQIRDLMHVEDVGGAFVELLDGDVQGAVNIASGEGHRLRDVATMIAEIIGKPELLRIGALSSAPSEPARLVADVSRLKNEVRFVPRRNLRSGLKETIGWWKSAADPAKD
ncbi:NAD(P)-dependent oxidoreductase [soil metagenome]